MRTIDIKSRFGFQFQFHIGTPLAESWYGGRTDIPNEIKTALDLGWIERDQVAMDIGAHHGFFSLSIAGLTQAKVLAFEPNPGAFYWLEENVKANPSLSVQPLNLAAGNSSEALEMHDDSAISRKGPVFLARQSRLDDFITERPRLLKIDVEGFEIEVLRGAKEILRSLCPAVILEVHHSFIGDTGVATLVDELMAYRHQCWYNGQWYSSVREAAAKSFGNCQVFIRMQP